MNLGLEHLSTPHQISTVSNEELLDAYVSMESVYDAAQEAYNCLMDAICTMESLFQIRDVIKQSGSTETIQYLYGQNNISLTMEGLGETISKGWDAVVKWFQDLWTKFKYFFTYLFKSTDKANQAVQEEAKEAKNNSSKKQPFKADDTNPVDGNPTMVAESFTNSNIQKIISDFDRSICAKANVDVIRSMNDEESAQIKQHGNDLADELGVVMTGGRDYPKKPVDEKFITEAPEMSKALHEMCKKGENLVNSLRTIPEKLKARAEKKGDADQLKVAQNTIRQAATVMNSIEQCAKQAANGIFYIKNRLEAFNRKFSKVKELPAPANA